MKAVNTQGKGISLAVIKGITKKTGVKLRDIKSKLFQENFPTVLFVRFMES